MATSAPGVAMGAGKRAEPGVMEGRRSPSPQEMIDVAVAAAAATAAACLRACTVALWLNIVWDEVAAVGGHVEE